MVDTIPRYQCVLRYRGIASSIRLCCVVDTPLLRRRYALVAPLIRPCCVVDTPLLIARFFPLCDTLVRNANRLYGKEAYSHFRVCFRLLITIEHFPFVSHSFPIRFTFGSHLRSSCCRPTRGVASGDASCCVARYEAMSWSDARPPWPFRSTDPADSVDRLALVGPPTRRVRSTDLVISVDRPRHFG